MKTYFLDILMNITQTIYIWAWRKKYSETRNKRYNKVNNKKIW